MSATDEIGRESIALEEIREKLERTTLNSIREVLPDRAIEEACEKAGYRFRERLLTPLVVTLHMVLSAIWPEESFAASWQLIWDAMVSRLPGARGRSPSPGSLSKARKRLPEKVWGEIFAWVAAKAQLLSGAWESWRGHRVVLLDGTCVTLPDEPELAQTFGRPRTKQGAGKYPQGRLVTAALAHTMTLVAYALGAYRTDETSLCAGLLGALCAGDLVVGDRHFAGANLYHLYLSYSLQFLTRAHQRLRIERLPRLISYAANDFVTELRIGQKYRKKDPTLPEKITVRVIGAVIRERGKWQTLWLVTSLLDAKLYPAREILDLYARRWRIETLFRELKVRLSADLLRSLTVPGVRNEIAARLVALNVVRVIMLEAAAQHGVDPVRISFAHATRAVLAFAPALATQPLWQLLEIYRSMLAEIASHLVPERPGRNEPRAVRHEQKRYPRLKQTRREWRLENAA